MSFKCNLCKQLKYFIFSMLFSQPSIHFNTWSIC